MHAPPTTTLGWLDVFTPCLSTWSENNISICTLLGPGDSGSYREMKHMVSSLTILSSMACSHNDPLWLSRNWGCCVSPQEPPRGQRLQWAMYFFPRVVGGQRPGAARLELCEIMPKPRWSPNSA